MLSLYEVMELERNWLKYRSKKLRKKLDICLIFAVALLLILFCVYVFLAFRPEKKENIEAKVAQTQQKQLELKNEVLKEKLKSIQAEREKERILQKKLENSDKKIEENKDKIPVKQEESVKSKDEAVKIEKNETKEIEVKKENKEENAAMPTLFLQHINTSTKESPKPVKKVNAKQVTKPKSVTPPAKNLAKPVEKDADDNIQITNIKHENQENSLESWLKKFNANPKDAYFAIEIAKEYYKLKQFKEARQWSLTANRLNNNSEDSWVLFAMSSYKLGQKQQAINALNNFLQKNKRAKKAQRTLQAIKENRL